MKVRLTQKNLLFGIYRGEKNHLNPGIHVWWRGRFIWPRERRHGSRKQLPLFKGEINADNR